MFKIWNHGVEYRAVDTPQLLLEHHLKALRLPTILREYDRVARQCAVEDHVHRIVEVRLFGKHAERAALHALEIHRRLRHQISTSALSPLLSSQSRRSAARFFASIISISLSV